MANRDLKTIFSDNPLTVDPEHLAYALEDPSGTAADGAFKYSQLMFNRYKILVTVATSDLTVKVTHLDGNDPSAVRPMYFKIGNTIVSAVSALSITIVDGTNWFNAGGANHATLAVPYFVYVVWDSDSSAVALTIGRKPYYRIVTTGMATTTSENHIYNYANFTAGDNMANIGYFEAVLSAGAGYTWTVPPFKLNNLRHEPTYESQLMTFTISIAAGNLTSGAGTPTTIPVVAQYKISGNLVFVKYLITCTTIGTASGAMTVATPLFLSTDTESISGSEYFAVGYTVRGVSASASTLNLWNYAATTLWQASHVFTLQGWLTI